jgi:hypothetical protein
MRRGAFVATLLAALALAGPVVAKDRANPNKGGDEMTKEYTIQGRKVVVELARSGRVVISVDGKVHYQGGPGMPMEAYGFRSRRSSGPGGAYVTAEFADVVDLKDHSVLVFETWHNAKDGLVGRVWMESVWPSDDEGDVDGYRLTHDGTYHACIETLPSGADPATARTAVKTLTRTSDTEFQYDCGGWGEYPARTSVYKRVLQYDLVEPPIPDTE